MRSGCRRVDLERCRTRTVGRWSWESVLRVLDMLLLLVIIRLGVVQ